MLIFFFQFEFVGLLSTKDGIQARFFACCNSINLLITKSFVSKNRSIRYSRLGLFGYYMTCPLSHFWDRWQLNIDFNPSHWDAFDGWIIENNRLFWNSESSFSFTWLTKKILGIGCLLGNFRKKKKKNWYRPKWHDFLPL